MPLIIGSLEFDELSGPTSLRVLKPTIECKDLLDQFCPVFLFLGDNHSSRENICLPSDDNSRKVLPTFTSMWLRLLDSISDENFQIEYFVEGNFPSELLHNSSYYISHELSRKQSFLQKDQINWNYESKDIIMSYIPSFHQECF